MASRTLERSFAYAGGPSVLWGTDHDRLRTR